MNEISQTLASLAQRPFAGEPGSEVDPETSFDRLLHATVGRYTLGLSPAALWLAYADWAIHLAAAPGKREQLLEKAVRKWVRLSLWALHAARDAGAPPCIEPLPQDHRFDGEVWRRWPFNLIYQAFLLNQQWWDSATHGVAGVSAHHEDVVAFAARQLLDIVSPVNFVTSNPQALEATVSTGGFNLVQGAANLWEDWERAIGGKPPIGAEAFAPGRAVAVTPGQVVFRNRLIELIQYAPTTKDVAAEPVLIVPAWIMKYYILDLSPENSLVKFLVDQGRTVFMISWRNPGPDERDFGLNDYLRRGVLPALDAVRSTIPDSKIDAVGYCLGGTLMAIAAAYLARERKDFLSSVTLLAAQTDFTEAGELTLFVDDSQLDFLEDLMWDQGYLDTRQMAGAFQILRSNDLIWSRVANEYLMGHRPAMFDLMAWNADTTRMPFRMHSEYLRKLFLDNELFEGRYEVDGRPISLEDIRTPIFCVSTEEDHVAPWRSVYKINLVGKTEVTFVLTNGGHNAGIVSEPGHKGRRFRVDCRSAIARYVDPDTWLARTPVQEGSWWPAWVQWMDAHSSGRGPPPPMGATEKGYAPLMGAPGSYVFQR
jgi:polyhydroxyalkanoate synthase